MNAMQASRFAFDAGSDRFAMAMGDSLVASSGGGASAWRRYTEAPLVAVGLTSRSAITVDEDGRMVRWIAASGDRFETAHVALPARGLAVAASGRAAVLAPGSAIVLTPRPPVTRVRIADPICAAFSSDGGRLLIATADGRAALVDVDSRAVASTIDAGAPVTGVDRHPDGFWIVTTPHGVHRVGAHGGHTETIVVGPTVGPVACSSDGVWIAWARSPREIAVAEYGARAVRNELTFACNVVGLAFGPPGWLGIGLEHGGVGLVELATHRELRVNPRA